jgi:hypothetical protein
MPCLPYNPPLPPCIKEGIGGEFMAHKVHWFCTRVALGNKDTRGSPRRPCSTIVIYTGAGAGVQSKGRDQGSWPMRSCAVADAVRQSFKALSPGLPQARPVRRSARPLPSLLIEKLMHIESRVAL